MKRLDTDIGLRLLGITFGVLLVVTSGFSGTTIRVTNTAQPVGDGRYNWTVFIEADAATRSAIKAVEYTLHPTFSNPVRIVTAGRETGFPLSSNGWGEFTIYVKVMFKNGKTTNLKYWLDLSKTELSMKADRAKEVPSAPKLDRVTATPMASQDVERLSLATHNTSKHRGKGEWEWSIFLVASDAVLKQVNFVEYTLHPTFANPVQRVTRRGLESGRGFSLTAKGWGTFEIAVKVAFTNGKIRYLKHQLTFG